MGQRRRDERKKIKRMSYTDKTKRIREKERSGDGQKKKKEKKDSPGTRRDTRANPKTLRD